MRQGRQNGRERADRLAQDRAERAPKSSISRRISDRRDPGSTTTIGGSATRRRASSAFGRNSSEALDQRMADIDAARAVEPHIGLGLERQEREHAIDIGAHRLRPARPPGPDARADIIDDRQVRQRLAHAARDAMGEIGAVDDDERIRARATIASAVCRMRAISVGSRASTGRIPITAMSLIGKRLLSPSASIASPPTPKNATSPFSACAKRAHQLEAELIARMLAGDERDPQSARSGAAHVWKPYDKQPRGVGLAGAALALDDEDPARGERDPAQLRPRGAAIVSGPIAGMSRRRSCPRLGALTRTPAGPLRRRRPLGAHVRDAGEHRVGSLGRLDGQHPAGADDGALPGVEARQRLEQLRAEGDVGLVVRRDGARRRAVRPARRGAARSHARRRCGRPRARRSRQGRPEGRCRRGETAAQARRLASPRPSRAADRRIRAGSSRRRSPSRRSRAPSARRTACRPRPSAPRRADRLRSPGPTSPTTPIRNGARPAAARVRRDLQRERAGAAEDRQGPGATAPSASSRRPPAHASSSLPPAERRSPDRRPAAGKRRSAARPPGRDRPPRRR